MIRFVNVQNKHQMMIHRQKDKQKRETKRSSLTLIHASGEREPQKRVMTFFRLKSKT